MNHDDKEAEEQTRLNPELEARVVAWVAGEASAFEAAELARRCEGNRELAIFKRRIEAVQGLVDEAVHPEKEPLRLSPERRAKLRQAIGAPDDAATAPKAETPIVIPLSPTHRQKRNDRRWLFAVAACVALGGILFSMAIPSFQKIRYARLAMAPRALEARPRAEEEARAAKAKREMESEERAQNEVAKRAVPENARNQPLTFVTGSAKPTSGSQSGEVAADLPEPMTVAAIATKEPSAAPRSRPYFPLALKTAPGKHAWGGKPVQPPPPPSPDTATRSTDDQVAVLSPLVVKTDADQGDAATSTLAGTRRRPDLKDVTSSVTVVTKDFLSDTGATNNQSLLESNAKPEVAGLENKGAGQDDAGSAAGVLVAEKPSVVDSLSRPAPEQTVFDSNLQPGDKIERFGFSGFSSGGNFKGESVVVPPLQNGDRSTSAFYGKAPQLAKDRFRDGEGRAQSAAPAADPEQNAPPPAEGRDGALSPSVADANRLALVGGISANAEARGEPEKQRAAGEKPKAVVPQPEPSEATSAETNAAKEPVSTFSLHVSDVSFRLAQAALARGEAPDPERIRPEEFYNAFDYGDPAPMPSEKIACRIEQAAHPFLQQRNFVRLALRVPATGRGAGQPLRLTVLLDTSGSMEREDRAASVRAAMAVLVSLLGPNDRLTLIGFARQPRLLAEQFSGDRGAEILDLIAHTPPEGGTNLEEALQLGGELAARQFAPAAQNRVVLLTDGAANLGNADPAQLARTIETLRQQGIAFDACGVGTDGLDDAMLEALTRHGDGRYYVLASPDAADAGFARQLAGAFRPAAENVKVQVRFNPARVGNYRLLGFEQHRLREEDFRNDQVDAAELAAEEAAVALYQVEPLPQGEGELGEVYVRFRDAATGQMVERSWTMVYDPQVRAFDRATPTMQLAGTAALLAEILRGGAAAQPVDLGELAPVVNALRGHYVHEARVQELVTMFEQTRRLLGK